MINRDDIRNGELEKCKGYTLRQIKLDITLYKLVKFLFSKTFIFIWYAAIITLVSSLINTTLLSKLVIITISHFIMFVLINPILDKVLKTNETLEELDILISVNREVLKERKDLS